MPKRQEEPDAVEKRVEEIKEQEGLPEEVVRRQESDVRESYGEDTQVGRSRRATADDDGTVYKYEDIMYAAVGYVVDDRPSSREEVAGALKLAGINQATRSEVVSAVRAFRNHPVTD